MLSMELKDMNTNITKSIILTTNNIVTIKNKRNPQKLFNFQRE